MSIQFGGPIVRMLEKAEAGDLLCVQATLEITRDDHKEHVPTSLWSCILMRTRDYLMLSVFAEDKKALTVLPNTVYFIGSSNVPILKRGLGYTILREVDVVLHKNARTDLAQMYVLGMEPAGTA